MTVRELRELLFNLEDQEAEIFEEGVSSNIKRIEKREYKGTTEGSKSYYYQIISRN